MTEESTAGPVNQVVAAGAVESAEDAVGTPAEQTARAWSPFLGLGGVATYGGLAVCAAFGWSTAFLVVLVVTQLVDLVIVTDSNVRAVLARAQFGIATRSLARELMTAVLVLNEPWAGTTTRRTVAIGVLAAAGVRLLYQLVLVPLRRRIVTPIETLNIDLTGLRLPPRPHPLLLTRISERSHGLTLVALLSAAVAVVVNESVVAYVGIGAALAVELAFLVLLARALLLARAALDRPSLVAEIQARVAPLQPEVMLYHSGDSESAYQVNMWLGTIERLPRSSIVVLRERAVMQQLAATTLPVLCIPGSVDFMTFPLPDVRVAMYTANVGKTIHMLREPGVRHVFIGHGDSDKTASSNPFSKVYSEIWVAGEAGRDRYRRANLAIPDDEIVEVGRPQLGDIEPYDGVLPEQLTVLYAPTWEGWTNDPTHTSVIRTGPRLVERLVAMPNVRLIYKPHPLTGSVSKKAAAADERIQAAIAASPKDTVVVGPSPTLYECFNDADVLIADISSVLSDFIESQKPYVVPNLTPLDEERFRDSFPSASAAYLLDPAADKIGAILDLLRTSDPLAPQRRELKRYLLGADDPDAQTRFAAAVDAAYERAVALCPVRPTLAVTAV